MPEFLRQLHHIDKDVTFAINSLHCPASDFVWCVFSNKYVWFVMYFLIALLLFRNLGWKKAIVATLSIILTIVCCDQGANFVKEAVARLRPCCDGELIAKGFRLLEWSSPIEYGFYSAHAANAMGFAVASLIAFSNDHSRSCSGYGFFIIIWALLVGISRVFVGKHFLGDVLAGFLVGLVVALILGLIASLIMRTRPFDHHRSSRYSRYVTRR